MGGLHKSQHPRSRSVQSIDPAYVTQVLHLLQETWGHAICELDWKNPFQLLIATILSAQSTDKQINKTTPKLFSRYPTPYDLAQADMSELESLIFSTGFYRNKAKNLNRMAQQLITLHDGTVPSTMDELINLAGVARKTANVVLGTAFNIASGVVVDTHVSRIANRLALTDQNNPVLIERNLMAILPRDRWIDFSHQIVWHGRRICMARKPACTQCPLAPICPSADILIQ